MFYCLLSSLIKKEKLVLCYIQKKNISEPNMPEKIKSRPECKQNVNPIPTHEKRLSLYPWGLLHSRPSRDWSGCLAKNYFSDGY